MSNGAGAKARRKEEIAFLVMEQVLDVDSRLADAADGDKMPDGSWVNDDGRTRGTVEITSPPAKDFLAGWTRAKKEGRPQTESGSVPLRLNELADVCTELLAADCALENIEKLQAQQADEWCAADFVESRGVRECGTSPPARKSSCSTTTPAW
ncbi:hypothetical protein [Kocuria sp. U4B]